MEHRDHHHHHGHYEALPNDTTMLPHGGDLRI